MDREQIITYLRKHKAEFARRYSVRQIGIFGSFARDEAGHDSDIDIVVELDHPTFDSYMDLKFTLERAFERNVDLVLLGALKPRLKHIVSRETVYA